MKRLAALALGLFVAVTIAGNAVPTWTPPTKNVDGTTIPATGPESLTSYQIDYTGCAAAATVVWPATPTSVTVPAPATTTQINGIAPGLTCFRIAALTATTKSAWSGVVTTQVSATTPLPPTNLAFTVTTPVAYKMRQTIDGFSLVSIGTVQVSTECKPDMAIEDSTGRYMPVARSAVTLRNRFDTLPLVTYAKCA